MQNKQTSLAVHKPQVDTQVSIVLYFVLYEVQVAYIRYMA